MEGTTEASGGERSERMWRGRLPALALFVALACLQTYPLVTRLAVGLAGQSKTEIPNNDVTIFLWDFWWLKKSLVELHQNPAFCDWVGRPGPAKFVFPTLSLVNSVAALPLTTVFSLETTYNVLILVLLVLTGWSACLLVRDMTGSWVAGGIAGVMFGTSRLQLHVVSQINVFSLMWFPLTLLAGRRFLARPSWRGAIALGLCFLASMLSEWYHAVALMILLVLLAAIKVWQIRGEGIRRFEKKYGVLLLVWVAAYVIGGQFNVLFHGACLALLLIYMLTVLASSARRCAVQRMVTRLTLGAVAVGLTILPVAWPMYYAVQREPWLRDIPLFAKAVFSADLASYVLPGPTVERLFPSDLPRDEDIYGARATGGADVFPGYAAWLALLAAMAWRTRWGRRGGEWLALAGVFVVISLGPFLKFGGLINWHVNPAEVVVLPAVVFDLVAVFEGLRVFSRFAFPAYLCAAVFVGIQTSDLLRSLKDAGMRKWAIAAVVAAGGLIVAERLELPLPVSRVPRVEAFEWLRAQSQGTVLLYPFMFDQYQNLYSQTRHEKPMVNPYISRRPEDIRGIVTSNPLLARLYRTVAPKAPVTASDAPDDIKKAWENMGANWLVVNRRRYNEEILGSYAEVCRKILGLDVVFEDHEYVIYRKTTLNDER